MVAPLPHRNNITVIQMYCVCYINKRNKTVNDYFKMNQQGCRYIKIIEMKRITFRIASISLEYCSSENIIAIMNENIIPTVEVSFP